MQHDLTLTTSAMTLLPHKITREALVVRTSTYYFRQGDRFQPTMYMDANIHK